MKRLSLAALAALIVLAGGCGNHSSARHAPAGTPQSAGGSVHPPGWGAPAPRSLRLTASPVTTAAMYDTITLATVPRNPFALAGYTSGFWPTYGPLRTAWPAAHTVSIAISARHHAACLDVEPGDATPAQAPAWVRADIAAGFPRPCLYSSYWMFVNEVRPALARAGISRSQVWEWDADYTFTAHIDAGFDATQWTDRAFASNLDASVVLRSFLSIAQPPLAAPSPPEPAPSVLERRILAVRALLAKHRCRTVHGKRAFRLCPYWAREGRRLHRELGR